jgi:hypothetical protein
MLLAEFGTGQVFWSMLWFFLFFIWIWMLFAIFGDIFRDRELSGGAKAGWSIFIIFLPYLGVFVYLIARGKGMGERSMREAADAEKQFRSYVQEVATTSSGGTAAELKELAELRSSGAITEEDFQAAKAKVLGGG